MNQVGEKHLKRMIRCKLTGRFLTAGGAWTSDISKAVDFPAKRDVLAVKKRFNLKQIEVQLMIGNAPCVYDMRVPVGG